MSNQSAITKSQLCWVIIRTMGVIALFMTLSRVYNFLILLTVDRRASIPNDALFYLIVEALVFLAVTFYLTQEGTKLHEILSNGAPVQKHENKPLYKRNPNSDEDDLY